jgi:endo-1,4-beta-xylanase
LPDAAHRREWQRFVDDVVGMDYKLVITEFDVRDRDLPVDIPSRDRTVADTTKAYFEMMLDYPQLKDVLAWGLVDAYSWLQGFEPRADKAEARGSLFDSAFKAKPVHAALAQAFSAARPRA